MRRHLQRLGLTACLLAPLLVGCVDAPEPETGQQVPAAVLDEIPLPELGGLEKPSQAQVRGMYERVKALREQADGGLLLARGYGELGKLFNGYEFEDAAMVCYTNAERLMPEDYRWPYYRAHLFRRAGEPETAIRGFQRALELMKLDVSADPQQVVAGLVLLGELYLETGQHPAARLMFEQAAKIRPRSSVARSRLGQAAASEGAHAEAIAHFEKALELSTGNTATRKAISYQLGMSYRAAGELDKARANLEGGAAGRLKVSDPLLEEMDRTSISSVKFVRRAKTAHKNGRLREAVRLYRRALELDPEQWVAHMNLGRLLEHVGQADEALVHYRQATEAQPELGTVWQGLAGAYRRRGELNEALAALERARTLEPQNDAIEIDHAGLLLALSRPDEALAHLHDVLEREPANEDALLARAAAQNRIAGCTVALGSLEEASTRLPESHRIVDGLARMELRCGDAGAGRARALAEQAFAGHARPRYAETAAMASASGGDFDAAIRWQEKAIELARDAGLDDRVNKLESVLREQYQQGRPWSPGAGQED